MRFNGIASKIHSYLVCNDVLAADIVFMLDTSSGVGKENFEKMLQFMTSIVKAFDVDSGLTKFSVITYDSQPRFAIRFDESYYQLNEGKEETLLDAIRRLTYVGGGATRTDLALDFANREAWAQSNGGRKGLKQVSNCLNHYHKLNDT